jgi:outer membrane protein assembly factor BamB
VAKLLQHFLFIAWIAMAGLSALPASAEDWSQWRGPNRDGVWSETGISESFPPAGLKIAWRAAVGAGFSSPVVAGARVYVTDSQVSRSKARERVLCFDAMTGKPLWTHSYEADYADWAFDPKNPFGPRPTPIVHDGRLFTLGARGRLICFNSGNGKVIWEKEFANKSKDSAFTPSPLIEGNLLILVLDGLPPGPCVVALDVKSGKEIWRAVEDTPTLSSPVVVTAAGKRQLIVWTQGWVNSLEPLTGKPYWRERHLAGANYAVATPVFSDGLLLVSGVMYRLNAEKLGASVLWPNGRPPARQTVSDTSSPMLQDGYAFTCNMSGALACIDATSGSVVWETNAVTATKSGASIHITRNGKSALLFTDKGDLIRAHLGPQGYREISRTRLIEPTYPFGSGGCAWTPPAYANGHAFARSDKELVCAELARK